MKRILYIFLLLTFLACDKEGRPAVDGKSMEFIVTAPDVTVNTKAELTDAMLEDGTQDKLYVYAEKSDGKTSSPIVSMPGAELSYNSTVNVWNPVEYEYVINSSTGRYENVPKALSWDSTGKSYYRFYGYAYSSNATVGTNLVLTNTTYGRQFTVTQPTTGTGESTIDYLLSSLVNVAPSTNYPLVPIELEHAMARVDVDVQIADAMFAQNQPLVKDISVSVGGIKNKATMLCVQPKLYGEDGTNTWYITFEGTTTATYTQTISNSISDNLEGHDTKLDMSFMAVPVLNAEMNGYVLTLEYNNASNTGTSTTKDYTYTFNLKDYSPKGWVNGHKVKYVLTIDNSIHLKGSIVDYQDVDYIEAVLVPEIPETK